MLEIKIILSSFAGLSNPNLVLKAESASLLNSFFSKVCAMESPNGSIFF